MLRPISPLVLALGLPIVGTACWLEVPNLRSTEGGYATGMAASAPSDPHDPDPSTPETASGEATDPSPRDSVPTSEAGDPGSVE